MLSVTCVCTSWKMCILFLFQELSEVPSCNTAAYTHISANSASLSGSPSATPSPTGLSHLPYSATPPVTVLSPLPYVTPLFPVGASVGRDGRG